MIIGLCLGVATWIVFFFGHLMTMRLTTTARRTKIDRVLFLIGMCVVPTCMGVECLVLDYSAWTRGGFFVGTLWGLLTYVSLFTLYMPFFYTVVASLSVQTIVLLAREADGALPILLLFDQFGSHKLVAKRLSVLTQNGLVSQRGNEYRLTYTGRFIAQTFSFLKRFWRLWPGG